MPLPVFSLRCKLWQRTIRAVCSCSQGGQYSSLYPHSLCWHGFMKIILILNCTLDIYAQRPYITRARKQNTIFSWFDQQHTNMHLPDSPNIFRNSDMSENLSSKVPFRFPWETLARRPNGDAARGSGVVPSLRTHRPSQPPPDCCWTLVLRPSVYAEEHPASAHQACCRLSLELWPVVSDFAFSFGRYCMTKCSAKKGSLKITYSS